VKVLEIDKTTGKISLSHKAVMEDEEKAAKGISSEPVTEEVSA
jgi:predicted RNA-binding protein with RPS1 domain